MTDRTGYTHMVKNLRGLWKRLFSFNQNQTSFKSISSPYYSILRFLILFILPFAIRHLKSIARHLLCNYRKQNRKRDEEAGETIIFLPIRHKQCQNRLAKQNSTQIVISIASPKTKNYVRNLWNCNSVHVVKLVS